MKCGNIFVRITLSVKGWFPGNAGAGRDRPRRDSAFCIGAKARAKAGLKQRD